MDSKAIDGARALAEFAHQHMPVVIDKIRYRRKPVDVRACYSSLSQDHLKLGTYDYLANSDIQSLKQHFYVASKLILETVGMEEGPSFEIGREIFCALLSDNIDVVNAMAHVETPRLIHERNNPLASRFFVHMMQLAIRGEDDQLQAKIEKVAQNGRKSDRQACASGQDFYSLLLKKDKTGLENLIQSKHANLKDSNPIFEDFMSYLAGWETKLCWFKGIPVQIDNPLVPMELMPIQPLQHYDDVYEFLEPGWEPPSQGVFGKLSRWLKTRG